MATAKRDQEIRTKQVSETVNVVKLTVTENEAEALHAILRNVGGDRKAGREHADELLRALDYTLDPLRVRKYKATGSISFVPTGIPFAEFAAGSLTKNGYGL